jgi:hypothetical protein
MIISINKETKPKQTTGPKQKTKKLLQGTASAPITFLERKKQERQPRQERRQQMKHKQLILPPSRTPQQRKGPRVPKYQAWSRKATDTPLRALASPKQPINMITHAPTWTQPS